ncbi:MAG TPA: response regulator [Verrucomicrobiota bacterium]|nr:response regulator [Verrucomicrobiota bacterium]HNU50630.1 response regulator [Verrucomicrobiota bacterium]
MRILVVEDDPAVREMLQELLEINGYEVVCAVHGEEGLRQASETTPDLVVCDIAMPVMDGYAMLEALRRNPETRALPVILLTALAERDRIRQGMNLGADDYLTKPFTETELLQSIAARLEKKGLIDELDAFAHTVAHGLKNPLTPVLGNASLLAHAGPTLPESTRKKAVEQILESARQMRAIIDELLLLSSVRRASVTTEPIEMGALVKRVLSRMEYEIRDRQAEVSVAETWPPAAGHVPWIEEVWSNYVANALKYGGRDGQPPCIALGGEALPDGRFSRFWVRDSGAGLTPEQQGRLFVPFTRLHQGPAQGHGLGLSIVRRIVEKLDGRVGVESTPGAGSLFFFTLPAGVPRGHTGP